MKRFEGFPIKGRLIRVPALFFSQLLPQIDHFNELRLTLYCFWRLENKDRQAPYLWEDEIAADEEFMSALGKTPAQRKAALRDGLDRAAARGSLISVALADKRLCFVNTPRGRAMAKGAASGKWTPQDGADALLALSAERPNLFGLYEQNVGPLTPLIAEKLKDMESDYPAAWIEEAIGIAVARSKRSMAYIQAILKRWQAEGRGDAPAQDGWSFVSGKYRDEIEH